MKLLEKLFEIPSVSGYENDMKKFIRSEICDCCDEIYEDNYGNLIATAGSGKEAILINTPISEEGLFVTSCKEGKVKVSPIGNVKPQNINFGKFTDGVSTGVAILKSDKKDEPDISDLTLDFYGKNIECGVVLTPVPGIEICGEYIVGKSASVKAGIYTLIKIIKGLKEKKGNYKFVFSVEDNLGFKGAKVAFSDLNPDYSYVISSADDSNKITDIELSKGPAVRIKDKAVVFNKNVINTLVGMINLPEYQKEITSELQPYNNRAMYIGNGNPVLNLNIPVRYKGTFVETVNLSDINKTIDAFV